MEQVIISRVGANDVPLFRREQLSTILKGTQTCKLLGEDTVTLTVDSVQAQDYRIGDTITVFGQVYTLNQLPNTDKAGDRRFAYDLVFEGPQYSLLRGVFLNQDASGFATGSDFSLTGNLELFARVLLTNIQRLEIGLWLLGDIPATDTRTLSFNGENCLSVLQRICQEFGTEFTIIRQNDTNTIHFGKQGQILGHTFEYGRGRGVYALSRASVQNEAFITRLYAYGSTKNIPSNYRNYSSRLRLDSGLSYLENSLAMQAFGLIEGQQVWEDIYPRRTGKVSGVGSVTDGAKTFQLVDLTMDFNLLEESGPTQSANGKPAKQYKYLLPGVSPKLHFNSGNLAGYEFEINAYNDTTKTFTLVAFQDERGMLFPNVSPAFQASVGDTYVLIDVVMPETYVAAAEAELRAKATTYLGEHSTPRVQYNLTIDEQYLAGLTGTGSLVNHFALGDFLQIKDDDLQIDGASRIVGFTRDILQPNRYTLELADTYQVTLIERILSEQAAVQTIVKINQLTDANRARQGWRTTQETLSMIFNTDGYFDAENIKPESIETSMIVVGAKSQQFVLNCVIEPNYEGKPNVVRVNTGSLTHYTVEETIRTWQLSAKTTTLTDDAARYIYARCSKSNGNDASIIFSTAQIKPNDEATYYNFLVGVLHSTDSTTNVRWVSLTYGATAINGRFIKTGRIQSFDGTTYFDLDLGEMGGKITFVATDGIKRPISELTKTTIDGGIITSGTIMLAGVGGIVKAGVSGEGTSDSSVRFWAGATYANRAIAPYRVLQSGEMFARKRIELLNEANLGQAGISGSNSVGEGTVRFWAGKPYADRNTAPYRVHADGSLVSTAGRIGKWEITDTGILNEDGQAYIITRTSTNPMRTEARIGANVFPATFGGKGAAMFTANEPDPLLPNYAAVFEAANGGDNYAIYAHKGKSFLAESLVNGQAYLGQTVTDAYLLVDPSLYGMIEIYPQGSSAGIKFIAPSLPMKNGKVIIVFNCNDQFNNFWLKDIVRGTSDWQLGGGGSAMLHYSNGFWHVISKYDNNFGATPAPFISPPINNPPVRNGSIPNFITSSRDNNQYTIPSSVFTDPGDTLNTDVVSVLPGGVTFKGGPRTLYLDKATVQNGTFTVQVLATDSKKQSVSGSFQVVVNWPAINPAPTVANPIGNKRITGSGVQTFSIPISTFSYSGPSLSVVLSLFGGGALPNGIEFNPETETVTIAATVADADYTLTATGTDEVGQAVGDTFILTIARNQQVDITVKADPLDFVDPDTTVPPVPDADNGSTAILTGNPEVLQPIVEWYQGKARIRNLINPDIPEGQHSFYFVSGQTPTAQLSEEYTYLPGDEVDVFFVVAASDDVFQSPFNTKGTAKIKIGESPV